MNAKDLINLPPEFPASSGVFSFLKLINELYPAFHVNNMLQLESVLNRVYPFPYLGKDKKNKASEIIVKLGKEHFLPDKNVASQEGVKIKLVLFPIFQANDFSSHPILSLQVQIANCYHELHRNQWYYRPPLPNVTRPFNWP
jgi:hypothetical protein